MPVELLPAHEAGPHNPRWHEIRRTGVTASEIPVILGLSSWDSPWSLWHRKRGLIDDGPGGESADWGRRLEPAIADAAAERLDPHENLEFAPAGLYRHHEREWQMATPDKLVHDTCACCAAGCSGSCSGFPGACSDCRNTQLGGPPHALLEIKHPYSWDGWGDDGTDDIPAAYMAQVLWQLDVMDLDECWLAAYCRHEMRCYTILRTAEGADADLELMRKAAYQFLTSAEPPPLDGHPATLAAVKALHPDIEDREQDVPARVATFYAAAVRELDRAKERKAEAEAALRLEMGNARRAITLTDGPELVATRSVFERRSIDGKRLRTDHPNIAAAYTSTSTTDRLTPTRKDTTDE